MAKPARSWFGGSGHRTDEKRLLMNLWGADVHRIRSTTALLDTADSRLSLGEWRLADNHSSGAAEVASLDDPERQVTNCKRRKAAAPAAKRIIGCNRPDHVHPTWRRLSFRATGGCRWKPTQTAADRRQGSVGDGLRPHHQAHFGFSDRAAKSYVCLCA